MTGQKISTETSNLDHTKLTTTFCFRSGDISDVAKLLRREEMIRKKLRSELDCNGQLEKQIKAHEAEIHDERGSISYQLSDLLREMTAKFRAFTEEKLQRDRFKSNESAQAAIRGMMQKYEKIETQCEAIRKIFSSLEEINAVYEKHSQEMEELVLNLEETNQAYERGMQQKIDQTNCEIRLKATQNQEIEQRTQAFINDIDGFISSALGMKSASKEIVGRIENLKKIAKMKQEKVSEIEQWDEVVIDMGNRKLVFKTLAEREELLTKARSRNSRLEMYLQELESEERMLIGDRALKQLTKKGQTNSRASIPKSKASMISRQSES